MEKHKLIEREMDLMQAIEHHSADEIVAYKEVDGIPILLGYYFPKEYMPDKKYPLFVFVHGGGWTTHKVFDDQPHWQGDYLGYLGRYYANQGFVCVSIDYRLTKGAGQVEGYQIIDCYDDSCDAIDYIIAHKDEYGIDEKQIYLLGESAGGYLAGALATFRYDRKYAFKKVFLINPITHLYGSWETRVPIESNHPKLSNLSEEERKKFLSPLYQIQKDMSEVVLIHGEDDTIVDPKHSIMFYERMIEMGCVCELHIIEKTKHAFLLAEYYKNGTSACKMAISIINQKIGLMTKNI